MPRYQRLDAVAVRDTVDRLQRRIEARFPKRNLAKVADEVRSAIDEMLVQPQSPWYDIMRITSRVLIGIVVVTVALAFILLLTGVGQDQDVPAAWEWAAIVEAMINDVVFAGIAVFFLWHIPNRIQRNHDLKSLHRLRSLAHIIDMHQLTKDPERLSKGFTKTERTIDLGMDMHQLWAYLDYCSELLSLVGKAAALFADKNNDDTVLATVEGIEELTTGMSRKIWQKISLLRAAAET